MLMSLWSSLATVPWQIFHKSSSFSVESSSPCILPCDRSDLRTCCLFKHALVSITCTCWTFRRIQRERKTRQAAKCPGIHWAHSRRLNHSALSEEKGGKGAWWCNDSHCQTSGTQLSLTRTCLTDLMWVCMWMFLCLRMRIRPTGANKVSLCTESGGTLVLLDCLFPLCGLEVPVSEFSDDLVSWMGNRPFVGETVGKKGRAISMQTSISPLHPTCSFGGLSLVSQTAKCPTCNLESLAVHKGLSFDWKPRQRQTLMFPMTAHPGHRKYFKLFPNLSVCIMLTTITMPVS